ncbi:MAG TPA: hypothetical protein VFP77_09315, partial [Gemmatimonadaceae bacterium]|nr:hypothetical protein [Gemmatimonadaceae bacterium]
VDRWRTSAGPILASAVESRRRMAGAQLRTRIVDPNVRLLLALLLALPDWSAIRTTLLRMRPSVRPSQFVSKCVQVFGQQRAIPFEMDSRATNVMVDILDGAADKVSDELHTYWAARFQSAELLTPLFRHD